MLILLSGVFLLRPVEARALRDAEAGLPANYNPEKIFYLSEAFEKKGLESVIKNADKIDILAPQFFAVTSKMKIAGKFDNNLKAVIKEKNLKVMPLIVNAGFSQSVMHKLLVSPKDQQAVITGLIYIAKKNNYIGWQFDFENISYLDKDLYSAFVEKAAAGLKKNGFILSVAAVSRSVDYENTNAFKNWGGVFDYARIAKAVDFISLMTYDDSEPLGPTASLPFLDRVLAYVKDKIPAEKLSMGIPFYYWGWQQTPYKRISSGSYSLVEYTMQNFSHLKDFDAKMGVSWLTYSFNNKNYKIWYEDQRSFNIKLDVVKKNNFRGFSAWVLGQEDPAIWNSLQ